MKIVIQNYLTKQGRVELRFKNNMLGDDFIYFFVERNQLRLRTAGNIKRSRAKVGSSEVQKFRSSEVQKFFSNMKDVIEDTLPENIFNYDETNVTDDPGAKKVLVQRGARRIERVQEHSKMVVSLMVCWSASGELLPPIL